MTQAVVNKIPMKDVSGKVALITDGSSGIGLGIARACVEAGMKVAIADRSQTHLEKAMIHFGDAREHVHPIEVDVTDRPAVEQAATDTVKAFGKVHLLVNNAAIQLPAALSATSYPDWDRLMEVNVTGVFNGIRTFLPRIQVHGEGGHILTTASVAGLVVTGAGYGRTTPRSTPSSA